MSARDAILGRLGAPEGDPDAEYLLLHRGYLERHHGDGLVELFAERVAHYRAIVHRVTEAELPGALAAALRLGAYVVPEGVPAAWTGSIEPSRRLGPDADLERVSGTITGCAVGIAETGTIVLDHGAAQGRRALTLVPDHHLVVVRADQVAADLPDGLGRLDITRPLTFISGPSATSDIELSRVEGVHGPRTLEVFLV
ncbi:L-lactate dehydrogenase complex protein LldG [Actinocorallia herbida]|uniref:L-lactate dehydrogenase complex protein LldG n=1 Tax=Actinocorallia herbida TaxID=58109 RepID=A0A3N1CZ16_9ACTN|nr:LUD domain-containing protein [Actinocorallia herbida]ROO86520.1 L-lactate dehydrogenase complex protein LldG [Actinocorallia herbida]